MPMTSDDIYRVRKQFFNDQAGNWTEMWYQDPSTGRYDKHEKCFQRLFSLLSFKPGDVVLDAGCGTGILAPFILDRITPSGLLYELDYAEKMIEANRKLHPQENIRFLVAEAEKAPLEESSCDLVICFSCFPHFHDKEAAISRFAHILKPYGALVLSHFESSEGIKKHHGSCHAVMHDHLPEKGTLELWLETAGLETDLFMDEPGFYCVIAAKP